MNKIDEVEYVRFCKEFEISIIDKIEGRSDQYKGVSQKDDKEYALKYIQFNGNKEYVKKIFKLILIEKLNIFQKQKIYINENRIVRILKYDCIITKSEYV